MNTKPKKTEKSTDQFIRLPFRYMKLKTKEIGWNEITLLALIGNLSQQRPCTARIEVMAGYLGVSERTVQRNIKKLIDVGYLISQPNPLAISGRTLIINDGVIDSICGNDSNEEADSGDNVVVGKTAEDDSSVVVGCQPCHGGTTDVSSGDDKSGFGNAENHCNFNDTVSLIDNIIDKEIENIKDNITPTKVGASAKADVNIQLPKEENSTTNVAPTNEDDSESDDIQILTSEEREILKLMLSEKSFIEVGEICKKSGTLPANRSLLHEFANSINWRFGWFDVNPKKNEIEMIIRNDISLKLKQYEKHIEETADEDKYTWLDRM